MTLNITEDTIRSYLRQHNFYLYREMAPSISKAILKEYKSTAKLSNKRNLNIPKKWKDLTSFGPERTLLIIDLGGTNIEIFKVKVKKNNQFTVLKKVKADFYSNKTYTPASFFEDVTAYINKLMPSAKERADLQHVVFIFSYPITQHIRKNGHLDATCTYFGKTRKSKGIVGMKIGETFEKYLHTNGYHNANISVTNDTPIYCLANKGYAIQEKLSFDAALNIIVGTGTNISSGFEASIAKNKKGLRIINTEFGDFKNFPLSEFDKIFNTICDSKNRYLTEKMLSGAWLHQMFSVIVQKLIKDGILQKSIAKDINLATITGATVRTAITNKKLSKNEQAVLSFLWREVCKRGGAVCGIVMSAIIQDVVAQIAKKKANLFITEVGSVLAKEPGFRETMLDTMEQELGRMGLNNLIEREHITSPDLPILGSIMLDQLFSQ